MRLRQQQTAMAGPRKPWRAEKKDLISHWMSLPPNLPVGKVRSIPPKYKGPTFTFDGVRITGSSNFINAALSRLKDLLTFESGATSLQALYKQQIDKKTGHPIPESYVFYTQIKERAKKGK